MKSELTDFLQKEFALARLHTRPLSLLLFDIDHFKRINDDHGERAGDFVLAEVARIIGARILNQEMVGHYSGKEFIIVLPETGSGRAKLLAEAIRMTIAATRMVFGDQIIQVTISVGVATLAEHDRDSLDLLRRADEHMVAAKRGGRNRIVS